jgi:hypothetical protein
MFGVGMVLAMVLVSGLLHGLAERHALPHIAASIAR